MKLFCESTESHREFMNKIAVNSYERSITMKPNFALFDLPENDFGVLFLFTNNLLFRRKTYTAKAKMLTFTWKR